MRWPWQSDEDKHQPTPPPLPPILSKEFWTDPNTFLSPRVLIPASILATGSLTLIYAYKTYVRRIPESSQIYPSFFRKRSLFGTVTSVGDADNFRLYHTPGGRLLGWGWFPGRRVPTDRKELRDRTVHIRIAGVDAPECGHFGNRAQPHSAESLEWLRNYLLGHRVRAYIYRRDQYERVVGSCKIRKGLFRKDLGLEMLKAGMAAVYEGKTGAEFGGLEAKYRAAEAVAKAKRVGMWGVAGPYQSPGTYKKAIREAEAAAAMAPAKSLMPSSPKPSSPKPSSPKPSSPKPSSPKPSSPKPSSPKPSSPIPNSPKPSSPKPNSPKPNSPKPNSPKPNSPPGGTVGKVDTGNRPAKAGVVVVGRPSGIPARKYR